MLDPLLPIVEEEGSHACQVPMGTYPTIHSQAERPGAQDPESHWDRSLLTALGSPVSKLFFLVSFPPIP